MRLAVSPDTLFLMSIRKLTVDEAYELYQSDRDLVVLDVRTPSEYAGDTGHLRNSILMPVQELSARWKELEPLKERPIMVMCRSGNRSAMACRYLSQMGFRTLYDAPGIVAWNLRKFEVEVGPSAEGRP